MLTITYIGHATTLIEANGKAVLTDPHFSKRTLFVKRSEELCYDPGDLPKLSAVVISHAHHDHLDLASFKYIDGSVPVFVPEGLAKFLGRFIQNPVIELGHYATHTLSDGTKISAVDAKHTGFRWTGLRFRKCNGYIIDIDGAKAYFAGDTAYGDHFKEIKTFFGAESQLDAALLPIGAYEPRWLQKRRNMTPLESVEAFIDTGAKAMVPIHYGSFRISAEKLSAPLEWLNRVAMERNLADNIRPLRSGERLEIN